MAKEYRTREGDITAVDTKTQLTTLGSEGDPGPLLVPAGVSRLVGLWVAVGANYASAGSASFLVRLEGPGLPEGPEVIAAGALGGNSATGVQSGSAAKYVPLGVRVTPGNEILVFGEMCGADIGQATMSVTLVFE